MPAHASQAFSTSTIRLYRFGGLVHFGTWDKVGVSIVTNLAIWLQDINKLTYLLTYLG